MELSAIPDCADLAKYFPVFLIWSISLSSLNITVDFDFKSNHYV